MKYIATKYLLECVKALEGHHVFYCTTYLACKEIKLPVGKPKSLSIDHLNKDFLVKHYRIHPGSEWFFRVSRTSDKKKDWLKPDYASSGLQSVNTRTFGSAFLHEVGVSQWGWQPNYVETLKEKLPRQRKIPLVYLACWILKDEAWSDATTASQIITRFVDQFSLGNTEINAIFSDYDNVSIDFSETPFDYKGFLSSYSKPPDLKPEGGGRLSLLEASGTGYIKNLNLKFGDRVNIITGDNGLGKTFILDLAWWALTGHWAGGPALPNSAVTAKNSKIKFQISSNTPGEIIQVFYSLKDGLWPTPRKRPTLSGMVLYARVDGSFSLWDPLRTPQNSLNFDRKEVWEGNNDSIEGLQRDWLNWMHAGKPEFEKLKKALRLLSPPDLGIFEPGPAVTLLGEHRETPTIVHRYGQIPLKMASAGIRRILTLAYLIVWSWAQHLNFSKHKGVKPEKTIVLLLDEAEAHLHPKWQRVLLPSILKVLESITGMSDSQVIVTTHSPLVVASLDEDFDRLTDRSYHLECTLSGSVDLDEREFIRHGSIDNWLTSEFGLEPRSRAGEIAIIRANQLQEDESSANTESVEEITVELKKLLPPDDPFWLSWILFADDYGVSI